MSAMQLVVFFVVWFILAAIFAVGFGFWVRAGRQNWDEKYEYLNHESDGLNEDK